MKRARLAKKIRTDLAANTAEIDRLETKLRDINAGGVCYNPQRNGMIQARIRAVCRARDLILTPPLFSFEP